MRPESAKLLKDIADASERIVEYTRNKSRQDYLSDSELRDAVHWNFVIVGEALNQLNKFDANTARQIHEWHRIIAFRNQLIHGYGVISDGITWDIIEHKLSVLRVDVRTLLGEQ
jgi:uncharacterized protein with HEPN domain